MKTPEDALDLKSATRRLLTSMQRKGGERTRAKLAGTKVFIWSDEHRAYWRPGRAGYTTHQIAAGIYDFEDAWNSTRHCGPEKRIVFIVIPPAAAMIAAST